MLKTENFTTTRKLCEFVNNNGLEKSDVQAIIVKDDALYLIYWSN